MLTEESKKKIWEFLGYTDPEDIENIIESRRAYMCWMQWNPSKDPRAWEDIWKKMSQKQIQLYMTILKTKWAQQTEEDMSIFIHNAPYELRCEILLEVLDIGIRDRK